VAKTLSQRCAARVGGARRCLPPVAWAAESLFCRRSLSDSAEPRSAHGLREAAQRGGGGGGGDGGGGDGSETGGCIRGGSDDGATPTNAARLSTFTPPDSTPIRLPGLLAARVAGGCWCSKGLQQQQRGDLLLPAAAGDHHGVGYGPPRAGQRAGGRGLHSSTFQLNLSRF